MDFLSIVSHNLLSPAILFFVLGMVAGWLKSDLEVPDSISRYLAIYLMMSIGFKGGVAISNTSEFTSEVIWMISGGVLFSFVQPFLGYGLLRVTSSLDTPTAAATAAHYGSISMVTFATASAFLKGEGVEFAGYIIAVLALMEAPAILSGLFIAHRVAPETDHHEKEEARLSREIFTNGSILLLTGAFIIGWLSGQKGMDAVSGFLIQPFQGFLCLFLMDMGLVVSQNLHNLRVFNLPLILFAFYMPILGSILGLCISWLCSVSIGTGFLFMVLCASASYIAVPAAMRLALPEAKAEIYIPMSLALTFPFNVSFGIPLYYLLAKTYLG